MKAKVLITGVAGLLGSHFSRHLLKKGYEVLGIDDFSGGYEENIALGVSCANINLADQKLVDRWFRDNRPDYVYHFAAYAAEGLSPFVRKYNYTNNLICSANLITAALNHDVKKFIFTSSMAVYGGRNIPPFTEDMRPDPLDPYGVAKYAVETDLRLAHEQFGLRYTIIRPHNVVGIYQNIWDRYRNVIGIWIRKALNNEPLTIFGDGRQKRAFSDISFYPEPFERVMHEHDGEIFNVGADRERTILEMSDIVIQCAKRHGITAERVHMEGRHEARNAFCNHDKAKRMLSFRDATDIEKTIHEMFVWALACPNRAVKTIEYETSRNIYSFWK